MGKGEKKTRSTKRSLTIDRAGVSKQTPVKLRERESTSTYGSIVKTDARQRNRRNAKRVRNYRHRCFVVVRKHDPIMHVLVHGGAFKAQKRIDREAVIITITTDTWFLGPKQ